MPLAQYDQDTILFVGKAATKMNEGGRPLGHRRI